MNNSSRYSHWYHWNTCKKHISNTLDRMLYNYKIIVITSHACMHKWMNRPCRGASISIVPTFIIRELEVVFFIVLKGCQCMHACIGKKGSLAAVSLVPNRVVSKITLYRSPTNIFQLCSKIGLGTRLSYSMTCAVYNYYSLAKHAVKMVAHAHTIIMHSCMYIVYIIICIDRAN